jgi:hypothetical protein
MVREGRGVKRNRSIASVSREGVGGLGGKNAMAAMRQPLESDCLRGAPQAAARRPAVPPNCLLLRLLAQCTVVYSRPSGTFTYIFTVKGPEHELTFQNRRDANSIGVGKKGLSRYSEKFS